MKNLTWQNPEQLFVAQVLINQVKSKCCGIKVDIIKKEKYINKKNVGTKSYKVGHGEQEYFGYGDGALPLVLSHNTPNNSILVLWQDDDDHYPSLFPRINRH